MMTPRAHGQPLSHARHQAGMSLIELMIAVAIGLALLAGLSSLYVSTSKARSEFNKTSEQVENGRFALQSITRDIEMAGFYGRSSLPVSTASYALPDPCATTPASMGFSTSPALTVPLPVYGPALAATVPTCLATTLPNMKTGAEVLTVSYVAGSTTATADGTNYYLQRSGCETDSVSMVYSKSASAFTLHTKAPIAGNACSTTGTTAELRQYVERSYYVATCDVCTGPSADTTPTLKVAEFAPGAPNNIQVSSLVTGIEDVHYSYGMDLDNNGSPDCYVDNPSDISAVPVACTAAATAASYTWTASATANWANVTAVRVNLLSRNLDNTASWTDTRTYDLGRAPVNGPYNDHYKRHVYGTVARIWNTGGMRENQ